MRVDVGQARRVNPGEVVRIHARLPKNIKNARLGVWSRTPGFEYSPHLQFSAFGFTKDGRPSMVPPMFITLNEQRPTKDIAFIADERLDIIVRQETDTIKDPVARVRINSHSVKTYRLI